MQTYRLLVHSVLLVSSWLVAMESSGQTVDITQSHPYFVKLSEMEKKALTTLDQPVHSLFCGSGRNLLSKPAPVTRAALESGSLPFSLEQTGYYLKDVYALIELTTDGKDLVPQFKRRSESGEIKIAQLTNEGQSRCPKQAAACYSPHEKTMYVDKSAELGVLAPILHHEISHAMDSEMEQTLAKVQMLHQSLVKKSETILNQVSQRLQLGVTELVVASFSEKDMEEVVKLKVMMSEATEIERFKTERKAYDTSYRVEAELTQLFPAYYAASMKKLGYRIPHTFSDDELIVAYALNEGVIRRYQRNFCQPLPLN